ncbi:MAG: DNA polymerase III subunit delta [Algoriphagus sp.]|uniref:DNA polymerase III subunit delta n=1 Tax=Algoriphagus sp. TaxID=1872435 RepID=UPI00179391CE|nr:DNA polymerase III subunit delta [Algoriphagus sp.]NVJ86074.1 DNA polymerase III subunit delta [Algoriphagus sp.]
MPKNPNDVIKDLKAGKFSPVYFLEGEEPYYIDLITKIIEETAIPEHERSFNQLAIYGKDANMGIVLNNARKFPMMAERQLVVIKEAQSLPDWGNDGVSELLVKYLESPLPSTILVFAYKYKKIDGKTLLGKALNKHAVYVRSEKVADYKMREWVEAYIKETGHQIDAKAATLLADSIGNNLEVMTNEISKMLINFKEPTQITTDHISKYVGINKDYNNFELLKAIGYRNAYKANQIIQYFSQNPKNHPIIPLFSLIYFYFRQLILIHEHKAQTADQVASVLKMNPFIAREYLAVSRNYNLGKIIEVFKHIREADLRYKGVGSGSMTDAEILRDLVYKILH